MESVYGGTCCHFFSVVSAAPTWVFSFLLCQYFRLPRSVLVPSWVCGTSCACLSLPQGASHGPHHRATPGCMDTMGLCTLATQVQHHYNYLITSAKSVMFSVAFFYLSVCLSVSGYWTNMDKIPREGQGWLDFESLIQDFVKEWFNN